MIIDESTTPRDVYHFLWAHGLAPKHSNMRSSLRLISSRRKLALNIPLIQQGVCQLSSVQMCVHVFGGISNEESDPAITTSEPQAGPSRHSQRVGTSSRMAQAIHKIGLNDDGNMPKKCTGPSRSKNARPPPKRCTGNANYLPDLMEVSDSEDEDFNGETELDDDDWGFDTDISNEELADILPSKTVPNAGQKRKTRDKGKDSAPAKRRRQNAGVRMESSTSVTDSDSTQTAKNQSSRSSRETRRQHPIYLFYEEVPTDADGTTEPGTKYYKCWHGNRKVYKITKAMRGNLNRHLKRHFLAHYRMYEVLHRRKEAPTQEEIDIARNKKPLSPDAAKDYLNRLETLSHNIQDMFAKQAAAQQARSKFEELLIKWIAACDQPFSTVKDPEFQALLQYTHHGRTLNIPCSKTIRSRIMKMYESVVDQYRSLFSEVESKFAISLDAWTSSNGYAFMAIIAHYVDNKGKLVEVLIDFRELVGEHSGANMAEAVWDTLEKFGITARVIAFMMDNATNNDTLVENFGQMCTENGILFSEKDARLRCLPHTIHLAALKLLEAIGAVSTHSGQESYQDSAIAPVGREFDDEAVSLEDGIDNEPDNVAMKSAVGKLRKIIRHVRSSPQRRKTWLKEVLMANSANENRSEVALMLILDAKTRWSSTHQMLRRALHYKAAINSYCARDRELRKFELEEHEWKTLKLASDWLKTFRAATTEMSTTKQPMLSKTLATFRGLQDNVRSILAQLPHSTDQSLRRGLFDAHTKLSDYYYKFDQSPYYTWAALLDPRISYDALVADYKKEPDLLADINAAKTNFEIHFLTKYQPAESSDDSNATAATTTPSTAFDDSPVKIDFLSRYEQPSVGPSSLQAELDEYFRSTASRRVKMTTDPLEWWHARRDQFPSLYRFARDILCIPGSAVAVERVFSGGRDTVSLRRASLKAETIQALMVVKAQLRMARIAIVEILGDD
ncbi:hypothetical protein D9758_009749 [Tetrapyrgos nigripes]|uniref:HAT C-terminal dimerisation domain-containing protein n=1 Tax=Tetrapyrgos nigripes TaxID=182062 RepID=A0A8H5GKE0_9AGAR|nr:hypothetical protein D9758_009749 [Tetrapyrgos nigripes]